MPTDMISQTDQLLAEKRAIAEQSQLQLAQQPVQQKPQYDNIYQALGSMTPMELLELKSNVKKRAGRRELHRNVGSVRGEELYSLVENGNMTIAEAIERSKLESTPAMKLMDETYFKDNVTTKDFLSLRERIKKSWTQDERDRWLSLYKLLEKKEIAEQNSSNKNNETDKSNNLSEADKISLELKKYKKMMDDGLISQEDYDAKKNKLLGL